MGDHEPESDNDNNDQVPGDEVGRQCGSRGPKCGHGPEGLQGPMGPVASVIMKMHAKFQIFSARDDENGES